MVDIWGVGACHALGGDVTTKIWRHRETGTAGRHSLDRDFGRRGVKPEFGTN